MKAIHVAAALAVSFGPASAGEFVLSEPGAVVSEKLAPHLNGRNEPLAATTQSQKNTSHDVEEPQLAVSIGTGTETATDGAEDEISAALKAKIRAIIAFVREDGRKSPDDTKLVRSRVHVSCSVRQITATPKRTLNAAPALMLSEPSGEPEPITTRLESCTIKLLQLRRSEPKAPAKQEYTLKLPSLDDTSR